MRRLLRALLVIVVIVAAVLVAAALLTPPAPEFPFFESDRPMVIAHQGGEGLRPSNTLIAFENAVALGVDVLEMDVHSTSDSALVLIHDDTVDRTTDGTGRVNDFALAELQQLDAGEYWTADDGATTPYRGQGVRIPTLDEVLTAFPQMKFNIEIKQVEPSIASSLCEALRAHDLTDRALIASFHPTAMNEFRAACPEVATSMVEDEIRPFFILNTIFLGALYNPPGAAFQVPEYSGSLHVLTPRFVRGAHGNNVAVHPWTIDDPADMARFLDMGVDGIITDRPDLMIELLRSRE
ncbi:MAG: glycerophosphodiester phosphodiesterase [Candidatus Promineofilum sp.]|nr:glycerophosphodiester phosphodiesterase [Promineifilum sp.]